MIKNKIKQCFRFVYYAINYRSHCVFQRIILPYFYLEEKINSIPDLPFLTKVTKDIDLKRY